MGRPRKLPGPHGPQGAKARLSQAPGQEILPFVITSRATELQDRLQVYYSAGYRLRAFCAGGFDSTGVWKESGWYTAVFERPRDGAGSFDDDRLPTPGAIR